MEGLSRPARYGQHIAFSSNSCGAVLTLMLGQPKAGLLALAHKVASASASATQAEEPLPRTARAELSQPTEPASNPELDYDTEILLRKEQYHNARIADAKKIIASQTQCLSPPDPGLGPAANVLDFLAQIGLAQHAKALEVR